MADGSSSSRDRKSSSRSSNSLLLQTIAQLRADRAKCRAPPVVGVEPGLASEGCGTNGPAAENRQLSAKADRMHSSLSCESSSCSLGEKLANDVASCKLDSKHARRDCLENSRIALDTVQSVREDDVADALAQSLGSLSIRKQNFEQENGSLASHMHSSRILDSYAALKRMEIRDTVEPPNTNRRSANVHSKVITQDRNDSRTNISESPLSICSISSDDDDSCVKAKPRKAEDLSVSRKDTNFTSNDASIENHFAKKLPQNSDLKGEEDRSVESITFKDGERVFSLHGKISRRLYPHQQEGIKWLWGLHVKNMGGILGDDMGLGKTMQIAAFLAGLFSSSLIKCAMVVAPKTLASHWLKELSYVGLGRKTKDYSGCPGNGRDYALQHVLQDGGVLLTTYDVVRINWRALRGDFHGRDGHGDTSDDIITWDYIILDEGHLIKNSSTQRAKSLREIPSAHRIVLSGTPIQNNLREMWALFDFCCPQLLGDKKEFKARYEDDILVANTKDASDRQKRIGSAVAQALRKRIAPFFLRRLKSDVFADSNSLGDRKISQKNDMIVWLRLTDCQRQLYSAFLESEEACLLLNASAKGKALAALSVLKKICDHPALLTKSAVEDIADGMDSMLSGMDAIAAESMNALLVDLVEENENYRRADAAVSCKLIFILALLDNLIGEAHRTLIFAQTRKMLNIIQNAVVLKGYRFLRIDGTTKLSDREKFVQRFQADSGIPIFLLTSQVGGLGLTLTGANRVVIVDPAWNPSTDNQSVDRAYRIGQQQDVLIYRLMTAGTIEEKIYRKQVFKGGLFKVATEHKEQFQYFSQQELMELLTLPDTGFDISLTQQQLYEEHFNQKKSDEQLKQHIKFLENQNIAGVSHHDLLFSKQAPELHPQLDDKPFIKDCRKMHFQEEKILCSQSSHVVASLGRSLAGKTGNDSNAYDEYSATSNSNFVAIKENINRLELTLADKATVSRLPDQGENIRRRIRDLTNELCYAQNNTSVSSQSASSTSRQALKEAQVTKNRSSEKMTLSRSDKGMLDVLQSSPCDEIIDISENQKDKYQSMDNIIDVDEMSSAMCKLDIEN